jgi:hypothetical protein
MRGQIIKNTWDESLGVAVVTKATPYGTYTEAAKAVQEDRDIMTSWDGFHFAEMKCDIAAMRDKAKAMRQRAIGAENALKALENMGDLDPYTLDKLERQVWAAYKEANRYRENYEEARGAYKAYTDILLNRRRQLRNKVSNMNPED